MRVGLDQAHRMSGLDRRKGEADCKRALATAALLGGHHDRVHCRFLRNCFKGICGTLYCCIAFYDAEQSRSGLPARSVKTRGSRLSESPNIATLADYEDYGYSGRIRNVMHGLMQIFSCRH